MSKSSPQKGVLVVPEFGITKILRGYDDFEDVYQGQGIDNNVIWLSDRKDGKDPQAALAFKKLQAEVDANGGVIPPLGLTSNDTGVNPWLQRGLPVPLGASIVMYLPYAQGYSVSGEAFFNLPLKYIVAWRNRSVSAQGLNRQPYHQAFDGLGQTDDGRLNALTATGAGTHIFSGAATARRVIQAFWEPLRYAQAEPPLTGGPAIEDVWELTFRTAPDVAQTPLPPLFPYLKTLTPAPNPTLGALGQGSLKNNNTFPFYVPVSTKVKGDELLIGVTLDTSNISPGAGFNFDAGAYILSLAFGRAGYITGDPSIATPLVPNRQLGVYVTTGSNP